MDLFPNIERNRKMLYNKNNRVFSKFLVYVDKGCDYMRIDDLLNILIYVVFPVLTVVIIFFVKRKMLWAAPIISTVVAFITYILAFAVSGIDLSYLLGYSESRSFLLLALFIHLVIVSILTAIACLVAYIFKRRQK